MLFWIGILVGGLFVWFAVKMGFYETWTMLFNIVVSVYLGVFLAPVISNIRVVADTPCCEALAVIAVAVGTFLILHSVSSLYFTGQFNVTFPRIFDVIGAGFLGFWAGFLVYSFLTLLISMTPIMQNSFAKEAGFGAKIEQGQIPVVCWWCDVVHTFVSSSDSPDSSRELINGLRKQIEKRTRPKGIKRIDPNDPNQPEEADEGRVTASVFKQQFTQLLLL